MDRRRRARAWPIGALSLAAGGLLGADFAVAANEAHVRTPVLWPSECARIVDRSVDPVAHFDYAIPVEDTQLTPDELPDSRTHQFVALCRDRPLTELLPSWITRDDVERSAMAGLIPVGEIEPAAVLDESEAWAGCFVRVTDEAERRPITFEQAALGVTWDTSDVAVGVWQLAGYTFEPPFNLWRDRPGFIKIVDDRADPEQDLPALALLGAEQAVQPGAAVVVEACVDALGPATLELEWAEFAPTLQWESWATVDVPDDGPLALEVPAPIAAEAREILVRARLADALGRTRLAYLPARVAVLACPPEGCPAPDPVTPGDPPTADSPSGCTSAGQPTSAWTCLALTLLLRRRRNRQRKARGPDHAPPGAGTPA